MKRLRKVGELNNRIGRRLLMQYKHMSVEGNIPTFCLELVMLKCPHLLSKCTVDELTIL